MANDYSNILVEFEYFIDQVFQNTSYDEVSSDGKQLFEQLTYKSQMLDDEAKKIVKKFQSLATTVSEVQQYHTMLKVIWRYIRALPASPTHKLFLMVLAFCSLKVSVCLKVKNEIVDGWRNKVAVWLGTQLTSGGQGIIGSGEGSAIDRVERFF